MYVNIAVLGCMKIVKSPLILVFIEIQINGNNIAMSVITLYQKVIFLFDSEMTVFHI